MDVVMTNVVDIFRIGRFRRLLLVGTASGTARWLEVLCFSVLAWQISNDATIAGWLLTSRMTGVILTGFLFMFIGARVSGQYVMLTVHALTALACLAGIIFAKTPDQQLLTFALISLLSGILWSVDFSFRRRMLADGMPNHLVESGVTIDVMSSHATRLVAMLAGGVILGYLNLQLLLWLLVILYVGSGLFLLSDRDTGEQHNYSVISTLGSILRQASNKRSIILVLALTPIFNIFALPYLALIVLVFLERFATTEAIAGSLAAVEGFGALLGGVAISVLPSLHRERIFVLALIGLLVALILIGTLPWILSVTAILLIAGMFSSIYSSMQSSLIYLHSDNSLRSPTFSLMTILIGTGVIGTLNVSWMAQYLSITEVILVMGLQGALVLGLVLVAIRLFARSQS